MCRNSYCAPLLICPIFCQPVSLQSPSISLKKIPSSNLDKKHVLHDVRNSPKCKVSSTTLKIDRATVHCSSNSLPITTLYYRFYNHCPTISNSRWEHNVC